MKNELIVLSGNAGVGKSTLGSHLANRRGAEWLSENEMSCHFSHLFADETESSRIISQLAFSTLRVATILSTFMSGKNKVVSERSLWDSLIFYEMWKDIYGFKGTDAFFSQLHEILNEKPVDYDEYVVWLKCDINILPSRIKMRGKAYDSIHTMKLLNDLEERYVKAFKERPPKNFFSIDVTNLDINNPKHLDDLYETIIGNIDRINRNSANSKI